MPWFKCLIEGENFPGVLTGEETPLGFYVTRYVVASDAGSAELLALESLRTEVCLKLPDTFENKSLSKVYFNEITEIDHVDVPSISPGFIFFPMASEE